VTVAELAVPAGRTVQQVEDAAEGEARVIAIGRRLYPSATDRVAAGERIIVVGSPQGLARAASS
jgi:Trk K+ transport system NAD-binding subunit